MEAAATLNSPLYVPIELSAGVASATAASVEWLVQASSDPRAAIEWLASLLRDVAVPAELAALVERDAPGRAEWLGATLTPLIADALLSIERSAQWDAVLVSLASSGKRRLLITPGRLRVLKRQYKRSARLRHSVAAEAVPVTSNPYLERTRTMQQRRFVPYALISSLALSGCAEVGKFASTDLTNAAQVATQSGDTQGAAC